MRVVVNDANILIDIAKLDLVEQFFELPFEFHSTQFIIEELHPHQYTPYAHHIKNNVLLLKEYTAEELSDLAEFQREHNTLSEQDCSAYRHAQEIGALLLTGDKNLRMLAEENKLEVHGIIWLFDLFVRQKIVTKKLAVKKLELLMTINKRLPTVELERRIRSWKRS